MPTNPKHKPGIHLFKDYEYTTGKSKPVRWFYWHLVSSNGRIIARSSETYTRMGNAVKSIRIVAGMLGWPYQQIKYFDHSQPGAPVKYC